MTSNPKKLSPEQEAFAKAWGYNQNKERLQEAREKDYSRTYRASHRDPITHSYVIDEYIEQATGKKIERIQDVIFNLLTPFSAHIVTWGFILFVAYFVFFRK